MKRSLSWLVTVTVLIGVGLFGYGFFATTKPVRDILDADPRNSGLVIRGTHPGLIGFSTLRLDLREADSAAPVDLWRSVFQVAEAFHEADRRFERVELARSGTVVFRISGDDFQTIGYQFSYGENPVYMLRKLPGMLKRPDGSAAYGEWVGGFLGVALREMEESNDAARIWARGIQ
jgi:hypothetical protein